MFGNLMQAEVLFDFKVIDTDAPSYSNCLPEASGRYGGGGGGGGVPGVVTPPFRAKHEYHYYATCL